MPVLFVLESFYDLILAILIPIREPRLGLVVLHAHGPHARIAVPERDVIYLEVQLLVVVAVLKYDGAEWYKFRLVPYQRK